MKQRAETLDHILDSAPATFTAPQLRVLIRALIHIDSYHFAYDVAAHFVKDDENNQQTGEEVLLSVVDGLEDDKLSGFALRLALTGHADIPARTRSTIWPRLKLSSLNRSPKRLRRRRPEPRRRRQSRPKPQRRRPPRNSQPDPQKGASNGPAAPPGGDHVAIHQQAEAHRAGQGQGSRHPRYNPVKDGRAGIRGGCSTCFSLYDVHQARIALDLAQREFVRRAGPWAWQRELRPRKAADATEEPPLHP